MSLLKMAATAILITAAALTGCSSSNYSTARHEAGASATQYGPLNTDYTPNYMTSTSIGRLMTTPQGATVYTFDKDQIGKSNCYGDCATQWPPMIAGGGAYPYGRMSLASRDDGQQQWAYMTAGRSILTPRMRCTVTSKGENVGNVWHVVR